MAKKKQRKRVKTPKIDGAFDNAYFIKYYRSIPTEPDETPSDKVTWERVPPCSPISSSVTIPSDKVTSESVPPDPHSPGVKLDAGKPRMGLVLLDFNRALFEVARVGTLGAEIYNDSGWKTVPNGVERYTSALLRHLLAEPNGSIDPGTGALHAAHAAWNALARLQLMLDGEETP